jgi:peptidoglycan/xylan/chitin deacetylase (PgdA/CDA1 family)
MGDDRCPDCESYDVEVVSVMEHEACGAVKFDHEFQWQDRFVCPDCGEIDADELSTVHSGRLYWCTACNYCFDDAAMDVTSSRSPVGPQAPVWHGVTTDIWTVLVNSRASLHTVATAVVLVLILGSAVTVAFDAAPRLEERTEDGEWHAAQSIVIFRNDDVQPYYRTEAMRAVDRVFIETGVPVTAGVIAAPSKLPIDAETPACEYWRERRATYPHIFEYALHGYRHANRTGFYSGSEFGNVSRDVQARMIERGRRLLTDCLGTKPTVFIPPFETYDANTSRVLAAQGFVAVSSGEWFEAKYANQTTTYERHGISHVPSDGGFVKNWSDRSFYSERKLEARFDRAYRNGSLYVQMIHYQTFTTPDRLTVLRGLIDHMQSREDVRFMTIGEFAKGYAAGRIERTDDGWRIRTVDRKSPSRVEWFVETYLDHREAAFPVEV